MKPKFGREIALLVLPILLFGGWNWWSSRHEKVPQSEKAGVEVLEAAMFPPWFWSSVELHIRFPGTRTWAIAGRRGAGRLRLLDGNGREVVLWSQDEPIGRREIFFDGDTNAEPPNPGLPRNERIVSVHIGRGIPNGGWNAVKRPLWVTGEVSDGECPPTLFKVRIEERGGSPRDFGVR